ncbi:MAG: toxin-activating lysine-acyltransferase [Pararhodobacter sp.]|nr:toxin-activating lysine-acyltransferase [Pararhodobacter sp.]
MAPALARMHAEAAVGQVVMALSVLPRYRHLPLSEIDTLVLQPLMRNRLVIAAAAPSEGNRDENPATGPVNGQTAGFAIWASVSEDADSRIREQIAAGVFPVRLRPEDWTGGSINWLLDVIAPDVRTVSAILANFRKLAGGGDLRLHPLISRLVPRETLEKMGASRMTSPGGSSEAKRPEQAGSPDA